MPLPFMYLRLPNLHLQGVVGREADIKVELRLQAIEHVQVQGKKPMFHSFGVLNTQMLKRAASCLDFKLFELR